MASGIFKGLLSILGGKVGTLLLGLVISPILVRLLGSSSYGDYAFLLSLLGITMILINAGIFDGTRKYIAEDRDRSKWAAHIFGFYLRVAMVIATTAMLGYAAVSWLGLSDRLFGTGFTVYLYLLGGLIVSRQAFTLTRGGLMGLGLEEHSEPLRILQKALFGIVGLLLVYRGYGVAGALVGHIVATITVAVLAFAVLFRHLDTTALFRRLPQNLPKRELLSFNGLSMVLILLTASLYHVDILLLKSIVGSQETGYYRAALVLAEFLWFVPNALQMVLLHSSSELWSEGESERITALASKVTRYNLSLTLLLAIGLAVLASDFVPLYFGPEFEDSVLPLLLLLPGALGFALARPIFAVGQGKGELRVLIAATGTAALINLVLNLFLIPRYGMSGAAIATSISYGSMILFHIRAARSIGFDPINDVCLFRITTVAVITAPILFGVDSLIDSSLVSLLIIPPTGLFIYSFLSIKLGVISQAEVKKSVNGCKFR